jgi:mono/diheme cytochrome c family protein
MTRRKSRIAQLLTLVVAGIFIAGISFTIGWRPIVGAKARALTNRTFEPTPARLGRGRYLVEGVLACFDCHSERDLNVAGAPYLADKKGGGKVFFDGPDGRVVAPNISPDAQTGSGNWTDDMLARAIREGIGHDGRALFPIMPYQNYRSMSDEDLASVIVYVRSIAPVRNQLPKTKIGFPLNMLIKSAPEPITAPIAEPDLSNAVKRGEHIVRLASCAHCHTPHEKGQPKAGFDFAGGNVIEDPGVGTAVSANLTPAASGISYYDEALFIKTIRTGHVGARKLSSVMPWAFYRNMSDEDLKAIFAYLRTLKPVKHNVDNAEPPTQCRLCGNKHGGGHLN